MSLAVTDTLAELAREAMRVQDACNLLAVARRFAAVTKELDALLGLGTDALRAHPIVRAWVDKLAHLTDLQGSTGMLRAMDAHGDCARLAEGGA